MCLPSVKNLNMNPTEHLWDESEHQLLTLSAEKIPASMFQHLAESLQRLSHIFYLSGTFRFKGLVGKTFLMILNKVSYANQARFFIYLFCNIYKYSKNSNIVKYFKITFILVYFKIEFISAMAKLYF